jgi:hypothetical protein
MDSFANTIKSAVSSLNQSQLGISQSQLSITHRKHNKISIVPLTREKVRVTHRPRRRAENNGNTSTSDFPLNASSSKKQA